MELRKLSVRVDADEPVTVLYARDVLMRAGALHVQLGDLHFVGRPAAMVDVLGRALRECYAAWGAAHRDDMCEVSGAHMVRRQAQQPLPPLEGPSEIDGTLSRGAVAPAKLLALDGGTAISDHPPDSGGGIERSLYLIHGEGGQPCPSA